MTMKEQKIRALLKSYKEAETSRDEENILRDYFQTTTEIPEDLKADQHLFKGFQNAQDEADFEFNFEKPEVKKSSYKFYKVAAVIIVLVTTSFYVNNHYQNYKEQEEARLVYKQTKEVLDKLSYEINKASSNLKHLDKLQETKERLIQ